MSTSLSNIDKRLDNVCTKIVARVIDKQDVCVRRISENRNEEIQFGRFICNERVNQDSLSNTIYEQFSTDCPKQGHLLFLEDTSQVSFSIARKIKNLGSVDKGQVQGFYLHPVLCLDAYNRACYGIPYLSMYQRPFEEKSSEPLSRSEKQSKRNKEPFENKESYRWLHSIKEALLRVSPDVKKTVVADRESDIYAVLTGLSSLGVDYVIRATHNRGIVGDNKKLLQEITTWQPFEYTVKLPATDSRTAHSANLEVRFGQVTIKRGDSTNKENTPDTHTNWVVYVKESSQTVVGNEKPVEWIIYTSHPLESLEDALQIITWYKERWNIEQLFRTLKTKGIDIMSSLLDTAEKLQKVTLLALMACVKVIQLVRAREGKTNQEAESVFTTEEVEFIEQLSPILEGKTEKLKNPHPKGSLAFAAWVVARMAGWSGYQKQRPPGPIDFLTGLKNLNQQYKGYMIGKDKHVYIL